MERRSVVFTTALLFWHLCLVETASADTGILYVHVEDNGQPVSDAVVTATCLDTGCDPIYTFISLGDGSYAHYAMRAPHNYRIDAEKGSKSATTTRFVQTGPNLPDVHLALVEEVWEASAAQASSVYGSEVAERSCLLNNMAILLLPLGLVVFLGILRRKK